MGRAFGQEGGDPLTRVGAREDRRECPLLVLDARVQIARRRDALYLLERERSLSANLRSALIYPALLIVAAIGSILLLLDYVLPQFTPIFEQAGRFVAVLDVDKTFRALVDRCAAMEGIVKEFLNHAQAKHL